MQGNDYARRFGGIARLYGQAGLDRLASAHVCVVGVGGVGSWAAEALARSGTGALTLIDLDNIAVSNTNRQLHALTPDFGRAKVSALHERILNINPDCRVTEIEDFAGTDNLDALFGAGFDFVVDAIDQMRAKAAMAAYFLRRRQPFVVSGGAGGRRNPALIQAADLSASRQDALLSNMRYTLRRQYGLPRQGKMRVPCVFSAEAPVKPAADVCEDGAVSGSGTAPQGLSCAGYGASMMVTAAFGLYCAATAAEHIVRGS